MDQWDFRRPPIMGPLGPHTIPIRIPKDMGMVWEAYQKGSHYWESLESPLNGNYKSSFSFNCPTTPKKSEYLTARSQFTERGPLVRSYSIFDIFDGHW